MLTVERPGAREPPSPSRRIPDTGRSCTRGRRGTASACTARPTSSSRTWRSRATTRRCPWPTPNAPRARPTPPTTPTACRWRRTASRARTPTTDLIADPHFTAPGKGHDADFRLRKGSPAIASGTPFPAVTTDFTGAPRKSGAPDRGAYSFGAAAKPLETAGDDTSGLAAQGASEPLAETGGTDPVLPLSIGAGVLAAGDALLVLARRRRA
ncbi:choice-of-anchor Q domain-containing protein [Streptomyces sp. PGLac3x]